MVFLYKIGKFKVMKKQNENALIIFTKSPKLGHCKTRIAKEIGDEKALAVYQHLLTHTQHITACVTNCDKFVYYSTTQNPVEDIWNDDTYHKNIQTQTSNLGKRMSDAFKTVFEKGYQNVIIIGSDLYDFDSESIEKAFISLQQHDFVIGPCEDGGYYLLGMKTIQENIFENKQWSSESVFAETLNDILEEKKTVSIQKLRNDIDYYEDIIGIPELEVLL